ATMATARQAAITRTILALVAVTNNVHVRKFEPVLCEIEVNDPQKLQSTFAAIGIQPAQLTTFRQILATFCPEIRNDILDPAKFSLNVEMQIKVVVDFLEGKLVASPIFDGSCVGSREGTTNA